MSGTRPAERAPPSSGARAHGGPVSGHGQNVAPAGRTARAGPPADEQFCAAKDGGVEPADRPDIAGARIDQLASAATPNSG